MTASKADRLTVAGYELAADRRYDPVANLWVAELDEGRVRVGLDPLGAETTGDVVAISLAPVGAMIARGEPLATLEAAKFVGPIPSPVSGTVQAVNRSLTDRPGQINAEPLSAWLVELTGVDSAQLAQLVAGRRSIETWFAQAVQRFRREGAIAQ